MEENTVGYRFSPTDEELINNYLKNKILGNSSEIKAINEININDYDPDPDSLRSLSKIQSDDPTWFFFAPVMYTSEKKTSKKRITKSGSWKPSGEDRVIKDKYGNKIGLKKTLLYIVRGASSKRKKKEKNHGVKVKKKKKNPWVMHEYQIQSWSHPDKESYVICKIKYKGEEDGGDIISSIGETSQSSLASDSNTVTTVITTPPEIEQLSEEEENGLSMNDLAIPMIEQERAIINTPPQIEQENLDGLFEEPEDQSIWDFSDPNMFNNDMQQQQQAPPLPEVYDEFWDGFDSKTFFSDNNDYRPKKPLSGIIPGYNTDSDDDDDAESISVTSYQGTLSPVDSDEETLSSTKDLQPKNLETEKNDLFVTEEAMEKKPEKKNPETEKNDLFVTEEAMEKKPEKTEKKNLKYVYVMNMIIRLILLVVFIGNIVSVLSTVKT